MYWPCFFNTNTTCLFSYSKCFACSTILSFDDCSFENLNSFTVSFFYFRVNSYSVSCFEFSNFS